MDINIVSFHFLQPLAYKIAKNVSEIKENEVNALKLVAETKSYIEIDIIVIITESDLRPEI